MDKFVRRQLWIMGLIMVVTMVGAFYSSYAFFRQDSEGKEQIIEAGNLNISYEDGTMIEGELLPMSDEEGMQSTPYAFEISNTGTLPVDYTLFIRNADGIDETTLLDHAYLRISIDQEPATFLSDYQEKEGAVYRGVLDMPLADSSILPHKRHEVRIWITEDAPTDIIDKAISLKLEVVGVVRES